MSVRATSAPVTMSLRPPAGAFRRADLEFHGVDHSRSSFTVRVFFNRPDANATTPTDADHGYAGAFHIFGHGGCAGQEGHCEVPTERRGYDLRPPHQLTPISKRLVVTEALRKAVEGAGELTVTVVPVLRDEVADFYGEDLTTDLLSFDRVDLLTYQ